MIRTILPKAALLLWVAASLGQAQAGGNIATQFTNRDSIINTRHNLTMRSATGVDLLAAPPSSGAAMMEFYRNDYGQVCVYCHTPHAANETRAAPLWNRNFPSATYTTYDQLNTATLSQTVYQPGAASLMCLSCHDGQQAVDAIRNMPGSGGYSTAPNSAFLDSWYTRGGNQADHLTLNANEPGTNSTSNPSCLICHQPGSFIGKQATDFTLAAIGTDLRDEHPIGVTFPAASGSGTDWKTPDGTASRGQLVLTFFDENANTRPDKQEIRLYDTGQGPTVECGSCHDPHGVPSNGPGTVFNPTFLRKQISGSTLCLTCHTK